MADLRDSLQTALGETYRIERELGGGGMSRVFLATETALGRKVVIKVLPPELAASLSVDRFRREIQLAASLQHPHIVPLLAAGQAGDMLYYTMPLIDGESLRARLARDGELPVAEAVRLLHEVVDALDYAHRHGVVHRDIKPDNILLSEHHAMVTDFGVAKALSEATGASALTSAGLALGTPAYMAPEQAAADPHVDHRADIYAAGALAYEMLTGRPPFTAPTPQAVLAAQITQAPEPIDKYRPSVPATLSGVVMRCLEKRPADRWQSSDELRQQLEGVATPGYGTTQVTGAKADTAPKRRLVPVLAGFLVVAVGVALVVRLAVLILGLPDWVFPGAVVLLLIGLPIMAAATLVESGHWLTWRKAILGGVLAFAFLGMVVAGSMTLHALGIGPGSSLMAAGVLAPRERILVADFQSPGNSELGGVASEALRIDLTQSQLVTVVPLEQVRTILTRMQAPLDRPLDPTVAREVALRDGIKAIVTGSIVGVGTQIVVSIQLISTPTGEALAAFRETAADSSAILGAIDRASKQLRRRIGESLRILRADPPLEQVTTRSLEALRKYSLATRAIEVDGEFDKGIVLLQEAIDLDTAFAMAYRKLGIQYGNSGQRTRAVEALTKAFEHRDRLTDRERYLTMGSYHLGVTYDIQSGISAYQALLDIDPTDFRALNNLAILYTRQKNFDEAERYYQKAFQADSSRAISYFNLLESQLNLGQVDSAAMTLRLARAKFPNHIAGQWYQASIAYSKGDYAAAAQELDSIRSDASRDLEQRADAESVLGSLALLQGRLNEAAAHVRQARSGYEASGSPPRYLYAATDLAAMDIQYRGKPARGLAEVSAALARYPLTKLDTLDRPYLNLAYVYADAGAIAQAKAMLGEFERISPTLRRGQEDGRHNALGLIALAEGRFADAITELRQADQLESCPICVLPDLGRAYDAANQTDSTLAVYQRYVDTPLSERGDIDAWFLARSYLRLGELYEERGNRARAKEYYAKFVALWKDADPELQPQVADAKRRLAGLQKIED